MQDLEVKKSTTHEHKLKSVKANAKLILICALIFSLSCLRQLFYLLIYLSVFHLLKLDFYFYSFIWIFFNSYTKHEK